MNQSESQQNLLRNEARAPSTQSLTAPSDYALGPVEKHFLLSAERGDCATVKRLLEEHKGHPETLDINCVDPLNRSALIAAIENENIELINILLELGIQVKDALLHAIKEEYVEAVEILLEWEERTHQPGQPYSWEAVDRSSSNFTPDITPLILAAHKNNYEILKILLDRGATLPTPHDARCGCDECVTSSDQDSLRHSQSRINAYRALTSSSLIALSSRDPLLTAFELSWELRRLSRMEQEFRFEYNEMREQTQLFATSLLDHARTSHELEIMLNYNPTGDNWEPGERQTLDRLKLAIKYKQKQFVAHPNVQQLLAAIWYDGLPGFRRLSMVGQLIEVGKLGGMFPVYSSIYMLSPTSKMGLFMKKPFVKFICHSSSYAFFLMLLGMASQRIEYLVIELFGNAWMREILAGWKRRERGCIPGFVESGVIIYIISLVIGEIRSLWADGLLDYISDLWNIVDFIQNTFYVIWVSMRLTAWYVVQREYWNGEDPWYPRDQWDAFDPMLLSEGAFAAGMIFSFLKLVHIFSVNPHLGPLQISLGRMIIDIIKFFFIYTLVLFAFGCGMNQLMWYYADLEKMKCYHLPSGLPDFDNQEKACSIWRRFAKQDEENKNAIYFNFSTMCTQIKNRLFSLFETSQSLFWASFGMVDLMSFDLTGIKSFTRFWALLMFGSYSVINIIVLLNMLIAMMSNSYQIISERADTEWKFARSHLWMSYFEDGDTVPPPFNMIPTAKTFDKIIKCGNTGRPTKSLIKKSREKAQERHNTVMRLLIRRYVTAEQRKRDDFGITEDDVMEIRQDISTLRYELIDILRENGMRTPNVDKQDAALSGKKGRVMERRLQKDFQIGIVEGIVAAAIQNEKEPKDVFSQIARAIGKRGSGSGSKKKDWNAVVRQNTLARDPIGSRSEAVIRQTRRSLRRQQMNLANSDLASLDPNRLVEYNPNLSVVSPTTRIAYAKFIMGKTKPGEGAITEGQEGTKEDKSASSSQRSSMKVVISEAVVRPSVGSTGVSLSDSIKKGLLKSMSTGSGSQEKGVHLEAKPTSSGGGGVANNNRAPSPIPEDPREDESNKSSNLLPKDTSDNIDDNAAEGDANKDKGERKDVTEETEAATETEKETKEDEEKTRNKETLKREKSGPSMAKQQEEAGAPDANKDKGERKDVTEETEAATETSQSNDQNVERNEEKETKEDEEKTKNKETSKREKSGPSMAKQQEEAGAPDANKDKGERKDMTEETEAATEMSQSNDQNVERNEEKETKGDEEKTRNKETSKREKSGPSMAKQQEEGGAPDANKDKGERKDVTEETEAATETEKETKEDEEKTKNKETSKVEKSGPSMAKQQEEGGAPDANKDKGERKDVTEETEAATETSQSNDQNVERNEEKETKEDEEKTKNKETSKREKSGPSMAKQQEEAGAPDANKDKGERKDMTEETEAATEMSQSNDQNVERNEEKETKGDEEKTRNKETSKREKSGPSMAKQQEEGGAPVTTTKLRGKSKATGRVMGGWI